MNGKNFLSLILAALTISSFLVSCKGDIGTKIEAPVAYQTDRIEENNENNEITSYVTSLASKVDGNGKTFKFVGFSREEDGNIPIKEEETGNIVSDAVYRRQREIEEAFGVDWINVPTGDGDDTQEKVTKEVMAGSCDYDLVFGYVTTVGQYLLTNGVLQTVDAFENIDLSREWWVQTLEDTYSIKGNLFFFNGSILVDHFGAGSTILFNKKVCEMFGVDPADLYQTVKDGGWTIDKMIEIASNVPINSNGSGVYRYLNPAGVDFIFSSGMNITKFDDDRVPYLDGALPVELSDLADKLSNIFGDTSQSAFIDHTKGEGYDTVPMKYGVEHMWELFVNNRALFYFDGSITDLRKEDVTFGVLPYPKGDDLQERYYSYTGGSMCVYFPKTVSDTDLTGAVTEAAAALGHIYLREACYEKMLKSQSVFDMESRDMLDIIANSQIADLAPAYSGGDVNWSGEFLTMLDDAISLSSKNFASSYVSKSKASNIYLKQFIKRIDKQTNR